MLTKEQVEQRYKNHESLYDDKSLEKTALELYAKLEKAEAKYADLLQLHIENVEYSNGLFAKLKKAEAELAEHKKKVSDYFELHALSDKAWEDVKDWKDAHKKFKHAEQQLRKLTEEKP